MNARNHVVFGVLIALLCAGGAHGQGRVTPPATPPSEIGGKSLDQWIKEVGDEDPSVREKAIKMWAATPNCQFDSQDVARVQKKLDSAKVQLSKQK